MSEITNEMAIEHLQESGWLIEHDRIMTTSQYNWRFYFDHGYTQAKREFDSIIEDIKAEIQMVMDMYEGCEYIGDKARRDELWHVLEIIDKHIGKENHE